MPGQGNTVYIFPAMGMAVIAAKAKWVTEDIFIIGAQVPTAEQVAEECEDTVALQEALQVSFALLRPIEFVAVAKLAA